MNAAATVGGLMSRWTILALRGYQRALSPIFTALGSQCRYEPSCSQYVIDAVQSQGVGRGMLLGIWRLLRCNPFSRGGYDPAPTRSAHAAGTDVRQSQGSGCFT